MAVTLKLTFSSDITFLEPVRHSFETFLDGCGIRDDDLLYWCWVGLQEALVNAIRHGNGEDPEKPVVFTVALENRNLRFEVRDLGPGIDMDTIPDPTAPENLMNPSGRGFLFMQKAMDKVDGHRLPDGFALIMEKQLPGGC